MKGTGKRFGFIYRIQNRKFRQLFFKNWLQVFLCIILLLILCVSIVQYFSERSLLREMDTAARRSTSNIVTTVNAQ